MDNFQIFQSLDQPQRSQNNFLYFNLKHDYVNKTQNT